MRRICALLACLLVPLAPACDRPTPVAPEGSTLTITANPAKIPIDGTSSITVLARKLDGTPVNGGTEISLSTNLGTIEELVRTDPGGVARATLTGDGRVGTAMVQAFSGAAGEASIEVTIGGLAAFLEVSANPLVIPRDGGVTNLLAQAFDVDGTPLSGAFISFRSEIGTLATGGASQQTGNSGQVTDTLTVTREDMGNLIEPFFLVTASSSGAAGAVIEESIEIDIGGQPATIFFQATPTTILVTGGTVQLLAIVRDGNFDPLPGIDVNFATTAGVLASGGSSVQTNNLGEARDTLTATQSDLLAVPGGSFNVSVFTGGIGGVVLSVTQVIRIQTDVPVASFTAVPVDELPCLEYVFTSTSTGQVPLTCDWTLDGDNRTGCASFNWSFNEGGAPQRSVTLRVSNNLGVDTATSDVDVPYTGGVNCN
ncbi:MAG: Ig-like domain-containing protein [Acidobacteriota bacterium]|nr:Ig-like domain-containing protein [Acidobacteriota bacterium]MDH3523647.1 Ig-like domain-containing protein [Acidobacteriota bacterium]